MVEGAEIVIPERNRPAFVDWDDLDDEDDKYRKEPWQEIRDK